ncbi:MAG: amino acid ABC transporter permease [Coprobacillus sp.]
MNVSDMSFFEKVWWIFTNNSDLFIYGIKMTLLLAIAGTIIGLLIGLLLSITRLIECNERDLLIKRIFVRVLKSFVSIYVWFFRGTPMMVQAIFIYGMLRPIIGWDVLTAGICIISLNTGAYMAEIVRAGIQSVDKGQIEGARSIGMSNLQTLNSIVLPQAIKNAFPSIGNQFIINIKDSCMLNAIGIVELFFQTTSVAGSVMLFTETFFITIIIYLIMTSIATLILNAIEKKINSSSEMVGA